jgi:CSLREA domain-containing protein
VGAAFATAAITAAMLPAAAAATDFNVNTASDMSADDGNCTLREAVTAANTNAAVGPNMGNDCPAGEATLDRVQLDPGATYARISGVVDDSNVAGDLDVVGTGPVSIEGTGSPAPTIDCNDNDRGVHALDMTPGDTLTIQGIRITDCRVVAAGDGGGALRVGSGATAAVTGATIDLNEAGSAGTAGIHQGGGILVGGALVMSSSVVAGNSANSSDVVVTGGGVELSGSTAAATISGSVISGNSLNTPTVGATNGAGVNNPQGDLVLRGSLVTGNQINGGGAGNKRGAGLVAGLGGAASAVVVNSTISGNLGADEGGEVYVTNDTPTQIVHSTIVSSGTPAFGDALLHQDGGAVADVTVRGSILTGPNAADVCELGGTTVSLLSGGYNVDLGQTCGLAGSGDAQNANPALAPLAANGGPQVGAPGFQQALQTHAISGGPALDRAPAASCLTEVGGPLSVDQRGFARPSPAEGSCDSGAFEMLQSTPTPSGGPGKVAKKCKKKKRKKRAAPAAKRKKCKKKKKRK